MAIGERDPVSRHRTTGHEWNGIRELDTPIPRGVLIFLVATHVFAILWWFLMPTWPLGTTYTRGLLGADQRDEVEQHLADAAGDRETWMAAIDGTDLKAIPADPQLMALVEATGHQLFGDNCAACHGGDGSGQVNYPDLADGDWLWGGTLDEIEETVRVGVNADHIETRFSQMPAFGTDGLLARDELLAVATYVRGLSRSGQAQAGNDGSVTDGGELFRTNCAACHGEDARGDREVGAPNLTDDIWIYGGDLQAIYETVRGGRQGYMPTWDGRLSETQIRILALYVASLGSKGK